MTRSLKKFNNYDLVCLRNIKLKNFKFVEDLDLNFSVKLKKRLKGKIFFYL